MSSENITEIEEFTKEEFEKELNKYKKVRDANYQKTKAQNNNLEGTQKNETNNNNNNSIDIEEEISGNNFKDALFQRLEEKLKSPLMAEAVSQSFNDSYNSLINQLSLDDINQLATVLLK